MSELFLFQSSSLIVLAGGVAMFLYGMSLAHESIESIFSAKISRLMKRLSENQFSSIVTGISLTTLFQSSGVVTSMLVNLGSSRVVTLKQVMGVIIGSAIGSTITVQLMSFNLSEYSLPAFATAFAIWFLSKNPTVKAVALALMGFSFLYLGLGFISFSATDFAADPDFAKYFLMLKQSPYLSLGTSILFCILVHSSSVTIALAMSLCAAGAIDHNQALFWIYGANVGTTSTALITAVGSNYIGKQVAWAHFFYKSLSVLFFMIPFVHSYFLNFIVSLQIPTFGQIGLAHLIFNVASALIFFPFIKPASRIIENIVKKKKDEGFASEFLQLNNYQSSSLAISFANREILKLADILQSMIVDSVKLFESFDPVLVESIKQRDNQVDFIYRETKMFLLDHANKSSTEVNQSIMNMIMFLSDLERAADAIDINVINLARKKSSLKLEFSEEGWQEILELHQQLREVSSTAINSFNNREMCQQAIDMKRVFAKKIIQLRENHISRLNKGLRETISTSSIHLDLLSEFKHISGILSTHAYN